MDELMIIFIIILLGYMVGKIKIKGLNLGTSGILIVALIFGHFGYSISKIVGDIGLVLFVGSVGFISGPEFVENFKDKAYAYMLIGFLVILIGTLMTIICIKVFNIPLPLALGLFAGALTSTPALGASIEATMGNQLVATGYGIAYVFGVVGVVIFVQLIPKLLKVNIDEEIKKIKTLNMNNKKSLDNRGYFKVDKYNFFSFSLAMAFGVMLGKMKIPLPGGFSFALGSSGGPLLVGILFGHLQHISNLSLRIEDKTLGFLRELGLALFLLRAGLNSGIGFIQVVKEYGIQLFVLGIFITIIPMFIAYYIGRKLLKLELFNALGSIAGAMTSTPALGTLIEVANGNSEIGVSYAATYPIALIFLVIVPQIIVMFFG